MNRTGDMILSIGFFALFGLFGSLNYETIFSLAPHSNEIAITIISLLLIGGSLAKSAQIPLHSWLPGSMEAPTPVSALLHAATLVTAGVYLLLRSSPILEYSPMALLILTFIGATTAFVAASSGLVQNDLKRIVAFSTISQLGYASIFIIIIIFLILEFKLNIYFNNSIVLSYNYNCITFIIFNKNKLLGINHSILTKKKVTNSFFYFNCFSILPNNFKIAGYSDIPSSRNQINIEELSSEKSSNEIKLASDKSCLNINDTKDRFYSLSLEHTMITNFIDKYIDFSFNGKKIIKQKYNNIQGIYLWINNLNNKSYVGKSVNIFNRLNKNYLSSYYINKNKDKMAICAAILKYGIKNFTFYILEVVNKDNTSEFLSQRENY
jgi:hypothetical protein